MVQYKNEFDKVIASLVGKTIVGVSYYGNTNTEEDTTVEEGITLILDDGSAVNVGVDYDDQDIYAREVENVGYDHVQHVTEAQQVIDTLIAEGIDATYARQAVEQVVTYCHVVPAEILGCRAVYECVNGNENMKIVNAKGEVVQYIDAWAGELHHATSPTMSLISLIYDSGYSLSDLGLE